VIRDLNFPLLKDLTKSLTVARSELITEESIVRKRRYEWAIKDHQKTIDTLQEVADEGNRLSQGIAPSYVRKIDDQGVSQTERF
jgi:hypothetical protein